MTKIKTTATTQSPSEYISQLENHKRKEDGILLLEIFEKETGFKAKMWGPSIVGFGQYHYKYESGHEGDMCAVGFSPRKAHLVLYLSLNEDVRNNKLINLGKYKTEKGCIYVSKIEDIDTSILKELIKISLENTEKNFGKINEVLVQA